MGEGEGERESEVQAQYILFIVRFANTLLLFVLICGHRASIITLLVPADLCIRVLHVTSTNTQHSFACTNYTFSSARAR